jgi:peptidoglycan/xylan/chitin deacetylase (PgdA/CDA1 family)
LRSGTLVLLYHRVAALERDPYELAVHPERFAQHCDVLRRRGAVVPLRETGGLSPTIAITFDDGYADNAAAACGVLESAGLPATFFISTGRLGERSEIWWDRLERILLASEPLADHIDVEIDGRRLWADVRSPSARIRVHQALYVRLRPLRPNIIEAILTAVESQLGVQTSDRGTHRWMTFEELRALSVTPGVDVGAHTRAHPMLAHLTESEQWLEIDGSRRDLEQLLERSIDLFSYPFGGPGAFTSGTTTLVRKSGYAMACSGTGGLAHPEDYPFAVPRNVVGDWDGTQFGEWLEKRLNHV